MLHYAYQKVPSPTPQSKSFAVTHERNDRMVDVSGNNKVITTIAESSGTINTAKIATTKQQLSIPLPYPNVVLRPDEMKFHCQTCIQAQDLTYSMVQTMVDSWETNVKCIPHWQRIAAEFLLRKYA
jgi:hypothetical protein